MTKITTDEVQHLAHLSSIELTETETQALTNDLEQILGLVAQLDDLDTEGVEPTYQVTGRQNVWRQDVVAESGVSRQQLLELSEGGQQNHSIKVPKVL